MGACYTSDKRKKDPNNKDYKEQKKDQNNNKSSNNNRKDNSQEHKNNLELKEDEKKNENEIKENNSKEEDSQDSDNDIMPLRNMVMLRQLTPYLQTKNNPNFNFPEIEGNIFVGKGLRKMKGYISPTSKEELDKKRIAFWETRTEGDSQVWNFLRELCALPKGEEKNLKVMLESNEITPLIKCINITFDKNGGVYEIPNYCINDPVKYELPEMKAKKPNLTKELKFYVRKGGKQIGIKCSNMDLIDKIKENIGKEFEITDVNSIRIFFSGKELKNGNELWKYNIEDECVILAL